MTEIKALKMRIRRLEKKIAAFENKSLRQPREFVEALRLSKKTGKSLRTIYREKLYGDEPVLTRSERNELYLKNIEEKESKRLQALNYFFPKGQTLHQ